MKCLKQLVLFLIVFELTNCSKDKMSPLQTETEEKPESEVYFTLNVDSDKDTSDKDNWLIIHDSNGKLLDFMPYESGSKLVFEANKDSVTNKISITKFVYSKDYVNDLNDGTTPQTKSVIGIKHTFQTSTQIEKGSVWNVEANKASDYLEPIKTGKFHLSIDSIPQILNMSISTKRGTVPFGYAVGSGTDIRKFEYDIDQFQDEDEYIVTILDGYHDIKYKNFFISDDTDSLFLKYSEFEKFDEHFEVDVPENIRFSLNIGGFEDVQEPTRFEGFNLFNFSAINYFAETQPLKYGYINRFSKFRTIFNVKTRSFYYEFYKYGDKPIENITVPELPNLIIENSSIQDFRFSCDSNFDEMIHTWSYIEGPYPFPEYSLTSWSVTTTANYNPVVGSIPKEILVNYPKINLEKIKYSKTYINLLTLDSNNHVQDRDGITIYNQ